MWESFDKAFRRMEDVFREMERIEQRSGWVTVTRTWTTTSTAEEPPAPTYSDGFADGWNAADAAR